jgi:hypothetical protein
VVAPAKGRRKEGRWDCRIRIKDNERRNVGLRTQRESNEAMEQEDAGSRQEGIRGGSQTEERCLRIVLTE